MILRLMWNSPKCNFVFPAQVINQMQQLSSDIRSLQAAADAAFIDSNTRRRASGQLVVAMILLGQGLLEYPARAALFSFGAGIVLGCEALWLFRIRRPAPLLGAAVLLWACAVWNLYIEFAGHRGFWMWAMAYLLLGGREFGLYRKFRRALADRTPESQAEFKAIAGFLSDGTADVIHPHVDGDRWALRLFGNGIVFRDSKGHLLFGSREKTRVEEKGATVIGGFRKVSIKLNGRNLSCSCAGDEAALLLDWDANSERLTAALTTH